MTPIVWGVLSTARIALKRVIPAMRQSELCDVRAIASRDARRAAEAARSMDIPVACASYEDLLARPEIEAIYIPLPNHLHVEWGIRALEAGKHVLCEKPIACSADEVKPLIGARDRTGLLVEEAVMVRDHPQWARLRGLIEGGRIGELRNVQLSYSHFTDDPGDIRNRKAAGGGGLLDIGSYCCAIARLIFDAEPLRATALLDRDPRFGTDRLASALLEFPGGHASFFCSTQSSRHQMVQVVGTTGWIRAEVPFAHPPELPARLAIGSNIAPGTEADEIIRFEPVNQYRLQAERFGQQIRGAGTSRWPLETGIANMRVLDAIRRSGESGRWESVSNAGAFRPRCRDCAKLACSRNRVQTPRSALEPPVKGSVVFNGTESACRLQVRPTCRHGRPIPRLEAARSCFPTSCIGTSPGSNAGGSIGIRIPVLGRPPRVLNVGDPRQPPSVDWHRNSSNRSCGVGAQEMNPVRDLFREDHAPERALPLHRTLVPIAGIDACLHLLGQHVAGDDCVDPYAARTEIRGENRGQVADCRLGRGVCVEGERRGGVIR